MESVNEDAVNLSCFDHDSSEHDGRSKPTQVLDEGAGWSIQRCVQEEKSRHLAQECSSKDEGKIMNT